MEAEREREMQTFVAPLLLLPTYIYYILHTNIRFHLLKTFWCILEETVSICMCVCTFATRGFD